MILRIQRHECTVLRLQKSTSDGFSEASGINHLEQLWTESIEVEKEKEKEERASRVSFLAIPFSLVIDASNIGNTFILIPRINSRGKRG